MESRVDNMANEMMSKEMEGDCEKRGDWGGRRWDQSSVTITIVKGESRKKSGGWQGKQGKRDWLWNSWCIRNDVWCWIWQDKGCEVEILGTCNGAGDKWCHSDVYDNGEQGVDFFD